MTLPLKIPFPPMEARSVDAIPEGDRFSGGRFRHGTRFLRWRPDKAPEQCALSQLGRGRGSSLQLLEQEE